MWKWAQPFSFAFAFFWLKKLVFKVKWPVFATEWSLQEYCSAVQPVGHFRVYCLVHVWQRTHQCCLFLFVAMDSNVDWLPAHFYYKNRGLFVFLLSLWLRSWQSWLSLKKISTLFWLVYDRYRRVLHIGTLYHPFSKWHNKYDPKHVILARPFSKIEKLPKLCKPALWAFWFICAAFSTKHRSN